MGLDRGDVLGDLDDDEVGGVAVTAVGDAEVGLEVGTRDTDGGVGGNVGLDVRGGQEEGRDDGGGDSEELHCWLCVDVRDELVEGDEWGSEIKKKGGKSETEGSGRFYIEASGGEGDLVVCYYFLTLAGGDRG